MTIHPIIIVMASVLLLWVLLIIKHWKYIGDDQVIKAEDIKDWARNASVSTSPVTVTQANVREIFAKLKKSIYSNKEPYVECIRTAELDKLLSAIRLQENLPEIPTDKCAYSWQGIKLVQDDAMLKGIANMYDQYGNYVGFFNL